MKKFTSQLDLVSVWKEKISQTNFQSIFHELIEKIDFEKVFTEQVNLINIPKIIDGLIQSADITQIIEKFTSKMEPYEIFDRLLNSPKLNEILLKVLHFDQSISPTRYLLKFLQLDQLFEHVQDPQTLFKWFLPTVNQSGIDHVVHDLQDTLQAVINAVTNTKDVLTQTAIKQGIPYVIQVFDLQNVISMDISEKLLREYQTFPV